MRILILDLDTLRPDHLGCYGYQRETSPNIDRIAADGVRFERYFCSDAPCLPSRASWITGRFGINSGLVGHGGTAADLRLEGAPRGFTSDFSRYCLTSIFRRAGLRTVSISPFAERHSAWWFCAGFNEMHNTGKGGHESAEDITPTALDWIERNAHEDNWLLHVNYWDAHAYYRAPESFGNPFESQPLPDRYTQEMIDSQAQTVGPSCRHELNMYTSEAVDAYPRSVSAINTMDDFRRHIDGYDCGIRYMDSHIGQLLAALEQKGVYDDLVVIVTADHGENQGELGIFKEHATADAITCRIPMIVRWPGVAKAGHVDRGLHYSLDLAPTVAELLEQPPSEYWDGRSYAPSLTQGQDTGRDHLVLSQCAHVCQRSVLQDEWLWIRTWQDGFHLFEDEMLFDLAEDPMELASVAADQPERCSRASQLLEAWHAEQMNKQCRLGQTASDPLWTVMSEYGPFHAQHRGPNTPLPTYLKRLEATGRAEGAKRLREKYLIE